MASARLVAPVINIQLLSLPHPLSFSFSPSLVTAPHGFWVFDGGSARFRFTNATTDVAAAAAAAVEHFIMKYISGAMSGIHHSIIVIVITVYRGTEHQHCAFAYQFGE